MRRGGAARIFAYNWPAFVSTWAFAILAAVFATRVATPLMPLFLAASAAAILWPVVALAVSHHVYDRSELAPGTWVSEFLPRRVEAWAAIDAGLDAEVNLDGVIPGRCVARLDVFDASAMRAPSIRRARVLTPRSSPATRCPPTSLALESASCDTVAVIFTAHEIRDRDARERFFREVARALREGGRMLLVEHVRDAANFMAFGPGFLHFLPRSEWLRLAQMCGLRVAVERRVTPWVMVLALEKTA